MRALLLGVLIPISSFAQADDPLAYTMPNGKVLHFQTLEQKTKFLAARQQAQQAPPAPVVEHTYKPDTSRTMLSGGGGSGLNTGGLNGNSPSGETAPVAIRDPSWKGGLKTLMKVSVDEVATSPFSLKDALIEMTGIRHVDLQEVAGGIYELTIWGSDKYIKATLPAEQARAAQASKKLMAAVKDPKTFPPTVTIMGNEYHYEALSTTPIYVWK